MLSQESVMVPRYRCRSTNADDETDEDVGHL